MLHVAFPPAHIDAPPPAMTGPGYLRLRRKAARLTIDDLARRIAPRERDRSEAAALLRMLETDGARARHRTTILRIAPHTGVDADVYFQLLNDPADRHPTLCRCCGCSIDRPCPMADGQCRIVDGICTRCAGPLAMEAAA